MAATLADLVPEQIPEKLAEDFIFTEGPVWHTDGYLVFSDIPGNTIYRYTPGRGREAYIRPSRNSNGLTFDRRGRLIACEHGGRQVSAMDGAGQMVTVASRFQGKRLNSPNDVVVHSSGRIFFTDPPYGIKPEHAEIGFNGVYRIDRDLSVVLLASDFDRPNGLAFSPDESVLYVDDSQRRHVRAFRVEPDLSLSHGRVLIDMSVEAPGVPDGMKVDKGGNLYVTGGGGIWVIAPDGTHLGTVSLPELPANVAFGGPDWRTLFATARTSLYSLRVNVPGIGAF